MSDPMNAPHCEGVKVLVIAASSDPDWSFAAFQNGNDPKSVLRRSGGEVGTKTVKFVGWDRVWLTNGPQLCQASMFAPPGRERRGPARGRPRRGARRARPGDRQGDPEGQRHRVQRRPRRRATRSSRTRPT